MSSVPCTSASGGRSVGNTVAQPPKAVCTVDAALRSLLKCVSGLNISGLVKHTNLFYKRPFFRLHMHEINSGE